VRIVNDAESDRAASDKAFVQDLENRLLPYLEGPEGDVIKRDVAFAHSIRTKAHTARVRLAQVQTQRAEGEAAPPIDGRLLRRKATLGPRLDTIIARAQARVRSVS
jgi:hypothetical protein